MTGRKFTVFAHLDDNFYEDGEIQINVRPIRRTFYEHQTAEMKAFFSACEKKGLRPGIEVVLNAYCSDVDTALKTRIN